MIPQVKHIVHEGKDFQGKTRTGDLRITAHNYFITTWKNGKQCTYQVDPKSVKQHQF